MKLYMFRTIPLSIIGRFSLYTQQWYMSYRFADSLRTGSGWNCSSISSMTPAGNNIGGQSQNLKVQSSAPDDGRKHRPKHVDLIGNK